MKKIIILDRDGVINFDSSEYIKSPDEWHAIPGSLDAIADLNRAGYHVVVVTNQSGVARGYYDLETLDRIHEKMIGELAEVGGCIDSIFFCPHHPSEKCGCRKPQTGMLDQLREKYGINLDGVLFVGDSLTDIQVAMATGCQPVLVMTGNGEQTWENNPSLHHVPRFSNLAAVVQAVLAGALL